MRSVQISKENERKAKIHMLLVGGGSLVGQNIMQAIGERRELFFIEVTNSDADEPSLADSDRVNIVPPTTSGGEVLGKLLMQRLQDNSCDLVIPCRDAEVLWLANFREEHPEHANRLVVGSASMAEVFLDKYLSWTFSHRHGLPFVRTANLAKGVELDAFLAEVPLPLIVKPRQGFASRGVSILFDPGQVAPLIGESTLILQPYLGGATEVETFLGQIQESGLPLFFSFEADKHSIQSFISPEGRIEDVTVTIHAMHQGVSLQVERSDCANAHALGQRCSEVFAAEGWRGPLNIQCHRMEDGTYRIYEYNGRFTGATAARALLACDELATALRSFKGIRIPSLSCQYLRAEKKPVTRGCLPLEPPP